MGITDISKFDRNHQFLIWLASMYYLSPEKVNQVCTGYRKSQEIQSGNMPDSNQNVLNRPVDAGTVP